ncbi:hypothetical protein C5B85_02580 [Pseudoclavibacter sp. AY1F1]|uniref:hypothetical protein n=1 Tax=Pseudoclavibacter sp. AY1F1 TaxID=2080583 RepID=UPI000CE880B9|nr:hypothetical protein [Pseudoclavibacter sp. AY1F1]PPF47176.1 hypothetical protein C5B85_02580 [Pseudoclavibacter sp. AY1F1]
MDASALLRRLRSAGAHAELRDGVIAVDGRPTRLLFGRKRLPELVLLERAAAEVAALQDNTLLIVVAPRASAAAREWVLGRPDLVTLVLDALVLHQGQVFPLEETPLAPVPKRGPRPYARYAVSRALLSGASKTDQNHLAELAGVTQGSVSTALRATDASAAPAERFDMLLRTYPGPGGQTFYWWSDRPIREQADVLRSHGTLTSGDFAADVLAPWRLSERAVSYARAPIDLSRDGFVLATESDYTAMVIVPQDPTLWATAEAWGEPDIADPLITAFDVQRTATTGDGDEAVEKLRELVVRRAQGGADG